VQDQVADAIALLVRTKPDLFVRQLLEAALDFWSILALKKIDRLIYECSRNIFGVGHDSSSPVVSGGRLCFALRIAGLATSSGLARAMGWPGGAFGLRMLSKTGLVPFFDFCGELFLAILSLHSRCFGTESMLAPRQRRVKQNVWRTVRKTDYGPWEAGPSLNLIVWLTKSGEG